MRKKIIRSFMITFLISFLLGFSVLYAVLYMVFLENQRSEQFHELQIIEKMGDDDQEGVGKYLMENDSRLTIIQTDGTVIYDNAVSKIDENHLQREEVQQALDTGKGSTIRKSDTTKQNYLYTAVFDEEDAKVIRLAIPFQGISQSWMVLMPSFLVAFLVALSTVWFISKKMATSIVLPLQKISQTIWTTRIGKEKIHFEEYHYPELSEITVAIESMNEEIGENLNQLEKQKQIRQEFFSNASHELKTPLTSIMGYTELLRTHTITDPKQVDRCLEHVAREGKHMTQLVNDILMVSKLESEEYRAPFSHISVREVLDGLLERFKVQQEKMNLNIVVDCQDLYVYANKGHIEGVFENLISNAIKYNVYDGTVSISCYTSGKDMILKVQDTGIGIPQEDQEKVFQRFYRVDKQRSKVISGTGLGLSIVKHIVHFYKGSIELESKEQKGTTITLSLPILVHTIPED